MDGPAVSTRATSIAPVYRWELELELRRVELCKARAVIEVHAGDLEDLTEILVYSAALAGIAERLEVLDAEKVQQLEAEQRMVAQEAIGNRFAALTACLAREWSSL